MNLRKRLLSWCRKPKEHVSTLTTSFLSHNFAMSPHFFLYAGFGLILLALIFLPAKVRVIYGVDADTLYMGPIYSLLIALWSFPNLLLGVVESSFISKKAVWVRLTPILCIANLFLIWIIVDQIRYSRGVELQMLLNYSPFLIPCAVTDVIGFLYVVKNERLVEGLRDPRTRVIFIAALIAVPILFAVGLLYTWLETTFSVSFCASA